MRAPQHLRPATRRWWRSVLDGFELEEHHRKLLTLAAQAWDRAEQARVILAEKGLTYEDRFKQPRARPELAVERDSRIAFARLMRELALDVEPPREWLGRPPTIGR
ncbi:MAG: P27 family phage terminase small subunit [Nitrospirota bacterium]|nr:P27 family phage terminase small subunit [Nitrospirota bacterium]